MIIKKILKQLTPERIRKEVEAVERIKLPPELQKWVKEYEKVGERPHFNFPWIYRVVQVIIFPGTIESYRKGLWTLKTLIFMFNILLDDVADQSQNKKLLENLLKIPFVGRPQESISFNKREKEYFKFAVKLWRHITGTIKRYPRYKEFKYLFDYDNQQYLNAMKYAYLINRNPYLINKTESWLYISHGMQVFPIMDVDLMCSKVNSQDLGLLREMVWCFQRMARIGNWVSTWEREVRDNDFTSGVWAYALSLGIIDAGELRKENEAELVRKVKKSKVEQILLKEWEDNYKKTLKLGEKANKKNIKKDLKKFLLGIEKLLFLHLISRYHK